MAGRWRRSCSRPSSDTPSRRFLGLRGGKALASTFGVWTALTVPFGPFVMGGSVFVFYKLLNASGWAVMAALLTLLGFLC